MSLSVRTAFKRLFPQRGITSAGTTFRQVFCRQSFSFSGLFRRLGEKETGKTAQEYIQGKIIELSKEYILGSQLGISQIAYSLGFQYPQHFSRLFKKLEGCTPNEFRNQAMS